MILNFKTRNEARKYCWKWNIPLKNIKKHNDGSNHPWRVTTEETMFKVGRDYKLVDVEGFTEGGKNRANKVQAEQINAHLNGVISLVSKDGDKFRFKSPANVAMDVVRPWEARFFKEVASVANAKPKKAAAAKRPTKVTPVKPEIKPAPVEDLDAVLDGGVNLAPVEEKTFSEAWPGKAPETPAVQAVDIEAQKRDQEIIAAAQKVEDALAEHQKAIEIVQKAARAVREAAQELALLTRK